MFIENFILMGISTRLGLAQDLLSDNSLYRLASVTDPPQAFYSKAFTLLIVGITLIVVFLLAFGCLVYLYRSFKAREQEGKEHLST